jgi:hypothetical protein
MTVNEWRFKICVRARDEWRKNPQNYNGLCSLFVNTIVQNGHEETDDKEFNELIFEMVRRRGCCRPTVSELIPEFVRPADADQEAVFWWIIADKQRRMEFLEYLVQYYAYKIDKES